jgi:DNA-binding MarR family transcriptional regulator
LQSYWLDKGVLRIGSLEDVAADFLIILEYMREKYFRLVDQITRSRLSHVQFCAMSILCQKGSLSMSELADEMRISKQQLTPLIRKLIDCKLLSRKTDPDDRRIVRLEVTENGRSTLEDLFNEVKLALVGRLKELPVSELDELGQMLKRILVILKSIC